MRLLRRLLPYLVLVLMIAGGWLFLVNRDYLHDQVVLRGYTPSADIAVLAADTAMTEYGQRLFYVNKPQLDDKIAFNEACRDLGEEAAVLGCYKGNRQGIHIYDITDPRLHGIEQVTAAHEMLHQAYDRLDSKTRARIGALLEDYYRSGLADEGVKSKMAIYEKDGANLANEMHSIFGTEINELPVELEAYYSRYFTDRQKVVEFRNLSKAEFEKYRSQIENYDRRLEELRPQIDQMEQQLKEEVAELQAAKSKLDADLAAGRVQEYNAGVAPYNALVAQYNRDLAALNRKIEEYNRLVQERNALSVQVSELNKALDSILTPQ
ncbi:MAG: hypothetical protein ACREGD_02295 [Candidatus Saccharimonadales bacterium]